MNLYPAIDIMDGQVVRLTKGNYKEKTVYSEHPEAFAQEWELQGADWLHIIDLDGAKAGALKNLQVIRKIRNHCKLPIQMGGGLRTLESINIILDAGIDRVILGTTALDQQFLAEALRRHGNKIAVGLDVRQGLVQTEGWLRDARQSPHDVVKKYLNNLPLETLIYTDIQKDGMLQGPNFKDLKQLLDFSKQRVILSGGIHHLDDIRKCFKIDAPNFDGVIIGKALYENKFTLSEASRVSKGGN